MPRLAARTLGEHRELIRARLLRAFDQAVVDEGYAAVTLAGVAKRAGIARNTVYNYFPNKTALLVTQVREAVSAALAVVEGHTRSGAAAAERVELLVRAHLEPRFTVSVSSFVLEDLEGVLSEADGAALRDAFAPMASILSGAVAEGIDDGHFHPVAELDHQVALVTAAIVAARQSALRQRSTPAAVQTIADQTVDFVMAGLRGRR